MDLFQYEFSVIKSDHLIFLLNFTIFYDFDLQMTPRISAQDNWEQFGKGASIGKESFKYDVTQWVKG